MRVEQVDGQGRQGPADGGTIALENPFVILSPLKPSEFEAFRNAVDQSYIAGSVTESIAEVADRAFDPQSKLNQKLSITAVAYRNFLDKFDIQNWERPTPQQRENRIQFHDAFSEFAVSVRNELEEMLQTSDTHRLDIHMDLVAKHVAKIPDTVFDFIAASLFHRYNAVIKQRFEHLSTGHLVSHKKGISRALRDELNMGGDRAAIASIGRSANHFLKAAAGDRSAQKAEERLANASYLDVTEIDEGNRVVAVARSQPRELFLSNLGKSAVAMTASILADRRALPPRLLSQGAVYLREHVDPRGDNLQARQNWINAILAAGFASSLAPAADKLFHDATPTINHAVDGVTYLLGQMASTDMTFSLVRSSVLVPAYIESILAGRPDKAIQTAKMLVDPHSSIDVYLMSSKSKLPLTTLTALLVAACQKFIQKPPDPILPPVPTSQPEQQRKADSTPTQALQIAAVYNDQGILVPVTPELNKIYDAYTTSTEKQFKGYAQKSDLARTYPTLALQFLVVSKDDPRQILGLNTIVVDVDASDPKNFEQWKNAFVDLGEGKILIQAPDSKAKLYFWFPTNPNQHLALLRPEGKILRTILDNVNRRIMYEVDQNGKIVLYRVDLQGTNAGTLFLESSLSTPTPSPSPTVAPTPTETLVPTATATPIIDIESPRKVITISSGEGGKGQLRVGADYRTQDGLTIATASGNENILRRAYESYEIGESGEYSLTLYNLKVENLDPMPRQSGAWFSPLSVFNETPDTGADNYYLQYLVNIVPGGQGYQLILYAYDWKSTSTVLIPYAKNAPSFEFGKFFDIRIHMLSDGKIQLWQRNNSNKDDWRLVSDGIIPAEARKHIRLQQLHAGLYGQFKTATVTNGKLEIKFK